MTTPILSLFPHDLHARRLDNHKLMKDEPKDETNYQIPATNKFDQNNEDESAFRQRRGVSTVELFYDLFIAANLATITARSEIVDAASTKTTRVL
jgi:hypothetical protein